MYIYIYTYIYIHIYIYIIYILHFVQKLSKDCALIESAKAIAI